MTTSYAVWGGSLIAVAGVIGLIFAPREPAYVVLYESAPERPKTSVKLLVIVPTPKKFDRSPYVRDAYAMMKRNPDYCDITETCKFRVQLLFVSGDPDVKRSFVKGDVLTVRATDIDEGDNNVIRPVSSTTTKVFRALQWATQSSTHDYDYVMRQGDDSHVNLLNLFRVLVTAPSQKWVFGRFVVGQRVREDWVRERLAMDVYPPYPQGMGYVMSLDVAEAIASLQLPLLSFPENAIVGTWLFGMDVKMENTRLFHSRKDRNEGFISLRSPCLLTDIVTQHMEPNDWETIDPVVWTVRC